MPTNYPGSADTFDVPGSPSTTPLSSAGSGSRNHVTHHKDLGDAVMALEANTTQKNHTHDGTGLNGPLLPQANTHVAPDTDSSQNALHHTLGTGAFQAAQGNHVHPNYVDLTTTQNITGKKVFSTGANAPTIPDFTYAVHNHSSTANGGFAAATRVTSTGAEGLHISTVAASTTVDFYLTGTFRLPAGIGLSGTMHANWILHNPTTAQHLENVIFYLSYNIGPTAPVYQANHNIVAGVSDHWRQQQGAPAQNDMYHSIAIPIYMPVVSPTDDTNMRISCRIYNATDVATIQSINFHLLTFMVF